MCAYVILSLLTGVLQYIIQFCSKRYGNHTVTHNSLPGSSIFVKRGTSNLVGEARTQVHFYNQAQQSPNAPRVARVYEVFDDGSGSTYLVMESISAPSFEVLINAAGSSPEHESLRAMAITKIAEAVEWLLKCPVPEGDSIGPVGGGYIQHIFFNMEEAPIAFATSGALEAYVNMVRSHTLRPGVFHVDLAVGIVASTRKNQAPRPTHNRSSPLFPLGCRFQKLPLGWQSGLVHRLATREPPPAIFRQLLLP